MRLQKLVAISHVSAAALPAFRRWCRLPGGAELLRFRDLLSHLFTPHRQALHLLNFSSQVAVVRVRICFPDAQDVLANSESHREIVGSAASGAATPAGKVASSDSRIFAWDFLASTSGTKKTLGYWKNAPRYHHHLSGLRSSPSFRIFGVRY